MDDERKKKIIELKQIYQNSLDSSDGYLKLEENQINLDGVFSKDDKLDLDVLQKKEKHKMDMNERSLYITVLNSLRKEWVNIETKKQEHRSNIKNWLIFLMVIQIFGIYTIVILIGLEILKLSDSTINITLIAVFGEIISLILIIVKYLFNGKDDILLNNIVSILTNKKDSNSFDIENK